jgi:hypothetical protein
MSAFAAAPASRSPGFSRRLPTAGAGAALGLAIAALAWRLSPSAGPAPVALGALALAAASGLAATLEEAELTRAAWAFGLGALMIGAAAASGLGADRLEPAFGLAALGLFGFATFNLAARARWRLGAPVVPALAFLATLLAALAAYDIYYVQASRDLMIADFMFYRKVSIAVASLIGSGRALSLIVDLAASMKEDYSWAPGLAPGLVMAVGGQLSRIAYQTGILAFYAAPAVLALGWLARELARRAGLTRQAPGSLATLALAVVAVVAAYPTGIAVAARGMPDIGGLALYVYALRLADRLARTLALAPGHDREVRALTRRLAAALALTLFAMFLFRRWYAFAGVGILAVLALEVAATALVRGRAFRWREAILAGSLGALTLVALLSPVWVDWLPNPAAHDYSSIYAAYRKPLPVFLGLIGDWFGWAILALAALGASFVLARSTTGRLARLTFGAAAIAAILFLRVQTPYAHHVYLIVPAMAAGIAVPILLLFARLRWAGIAAVGLLAAATLTSAGALAPKGLFPNGGLPHAPREDMAELARLKTWVDSQASPRHKVCGLGSSYAFSGQLIDELWQLQATRSPLYGDPKLRPDVKMSDVDTVEGPPSPELADCAILIVGDPVQTHLNPDYQQTVIVPSREMLSGTGIGAHYRRTGEVFHLEKGVNAVVFERVIPLDDADMAALADRWRAVRAADAAARGTLRP